MIGRWWERPSAGPRRFFAGMVKVALVGVVAFLLGLAVKEVLNSQRWDTGFGSRISTETTTVESWPRGVERTTTMIAEGGKTLWDWLDLLIIPAALGGGALWINGRLARREEEAQQERFKELALQSYFDRMSDLLLKESLRSRLSNSTEDREGMSAVVDVAQVRTITILRRVDRRRRDEVISFLRTSRLITGSQSLLCWASMVGIELDGNKLTRSGLQGTDLRYANLQEAILWEASLQKAILWEANLKEANLGDAYLQEADLSRAKLQAANLSGAKLQRASLWRANLQGAILINANLQGATLIYASLRGANLNSAKLQAANLTSANLQGTNLAYTEFDETTVLPDGTNWSPGNSMTRFTDPNHPDFWRSDRSGSSAYLGDDDQDDK